MSTISASTTSTTAYKVTADTTGTLVLQTGASPTTAVTIGTNQVVTFAQAPSLPAASIPQAALAAGVAGNGPAFSAYFNGSTSIASNTATKVTLDTEDFDTASAFNNTGSTVGSTPAYAFLPSVAGYYQIEASVWFNGTTVGGSVFTYIRKNGSTYKTGAGAYSTTNGHGGATVSCIVYLNGTTDYIELFTTQTTAASQSLGGSNGVYMAGSLIRAA